MSDMTIKEIEELATWAEAITNDAPDDMGLPVAALDLKRFSSALRQLLNAQKWREIETAPKDGTPVLLCDARTDSMRWAVWAQLPSHAEGHDSDWLGWRDGTIEAGGQIVGVIPTHWLPLPSPPQDKENGDG